jgi:ribosomal protein S18 acetylase RimI-like enzyme
MLRRLDASDVEAAAGVLARAFRDNPGMLALLPDDSPDARVGLLERGMKGFVRAVSRFGVAEAVADEGRIRAVSLSLGPGGFPPPLRAELMMAPGIIRAGLRCALRFARLDGEMRKRHPHYPHWYLWMLGVEPSEQGKGLGSELLRVLSARAGADRVPCYLETDRQTSVRLYEKHGYVVQKEEVLPFDLKLWFMKRPEGG